MFFRNGKKKALEVEDLELTDEDLARLLALARIALGAWLFLTPRWAIRVWVGRLHLDFVSTMAVRGMGARDVALGVGLLATLEGDGPARGWLEGAALADAADAAGTLAAWRDLPKPRALGLLGLEVAAAATHARLAQTID